jgi:hypothetical protein
MTNPLLDRFRGGSDDSDNELRRSIQPEQQPKKSAASSDPEGSLAERRIKAARLLGEFDNLPGEGAPLDPATDSDKKGPPLTAARVGNIAEQRIQAAIEDGMFDNLPGEGQPLNLNDDMHVPPDMRMAFRLMKGQNLGAPWVEPQRDYERQLARYMVWRKNVQQRWPHISELERDDLKADLARRIKEINTLIHSLNSLVPSDTLRVGLLVYTREVHFLET